MSRKQTKPKVVHYSADSVQIEPDLGLTLRTDADGNLHLEVPDAIVFGPEPTQDEIKVDLDAIFAFAASRGVTL